MSKLTKIALSAIGFGLGLGFLHAWLNLGFDPMRLLGQGKAAAGEAQFRVGFLPVT